MNEAASKVVIIDWTPKPIPAGPSFFANTNVPIRTTTDKLNKTAYTTNHP
jgi:hypothetical protein